MTLNRASILTPIPMAQSIEDAILSDGLARLDALLGDLRGLAGGDATDLRYGLEALRHFRDWYGADGALQPATHRQQQKIAVLEAAWGAELLGMARQSARGSIQNL